ncbi:MAG: uroporphyrinogen-III synthase [Pseudomonadota bacterium]
MTILLTRPRSDSERIAAMLSQDEVPVMIWPLTEIVFFDDVVPQNAQALAFSSGNAVRGFARLTEQRSGTAYCIGKRTAEIATQVGFADVRNAEGDFNALLALLTKTAPDGLHYVRGEDVAADLPAALTRCGVMCTEQIVYAARPAAPPEPEVAEALGQGAIRVITVWSRRNALLLAESLKAHPEWEISKTSVVAISDNAAQPLGTLGFRRIIVVSRPNATQMIAGIRAALR